MTSSTPEIDKIKDIIQDSNLNFLIGSGASVPFFSTLGNVENWLTELENDDTIPEDVKKYIRASIYKAYCDIAMRDNHQIRDHLVKNMDYPSDTITPENKLHHTLVGYKIFLKLINDIIYERRSNTVTKQVNLFTTNIDVFLEKAIEELGVQYNDGFYGIFNKTFGLSNYKKSFFQKSLHYDNTSELPVFNLLKMHGSVTWKKEGDGIIFDDLVLVKKVTEIAEKISFLDIKKLNDESWKSNNREITIHELVGQVDPTKIPNYSNFFEEYENLQIVNPNKAKFKDTTFNKNYYELLRMYANELEKEATSLFIIGFSLADEHIREITVRAIKSNPTLFVFICSYKKGAPDIDANLKRDGFDLANYRNVQIVNLDEDFNLQKINELLFKKALTLIKNPEAT